MKCDYTVVFCAFAMAWSAAGPGLVFAEEPGLMAQVGGSPATPSSTPAEVTSTSASVELDKVQVTGSRIRKADFAFSNPVVTIDADAIVNSGAVNLSEFLKDIPALTGSFNGNDTLDSDLSGIGGTGLELLNLRNLGNDRTLVLIDGKRHVAAAPGSAAVDVDTIPIALIERIEVQTGGASATYGADGVSGVVNFITRRDFEGLDVRAQFGASGENDAETGLASLVAGKNFAGGRGNVTGTFEYSRENRLRSTERSYTRGLGRSGLANNPFDRDDDPNVPDRIPFNDIRFYDSSRDGLVYVFDQDFNSLGLFNGDDTPFDRGVIPAPDPDDVFSAPIDPFFQIGGDGTPQRDYIGDLMPEQERYAVNTLLTWRLLDRVRVTADLKYVQTQSFAASQPTFDFFAEIAPDNPFIPSTIAQTAGSDNLIFLSRDNFDLGVRSEDIERETFRSVLGLDGDLWQDARFEMYVAYGQTEVDNHIGNNRFNDRFNAALDAVTDPTTGQPTCRSNLDPSAAPDAGSFTPGPDSGCAPLNLFGEGSPSAEAIDFVMTNSLAASKITQTVGQAFISGRTFNWLVPGASPMGYALGVERRIEDSESRPPLEDQLGFTFGNVLRPEDGSYNVSEAFLEVDVPVIENRPFVKYFSVDAALRLSNYSTVGSTRTWKVGSNWTPVRDITLRGTRAKATRAPNIAELFDPGGQTFELITDPCDSDNLDNGTQFRRANCIAILSALGVDDPGNFVDPNSASVPGLLTGNENLDEEDADTTTLGFVLAPRFLPGLSLAIDWYDIEIENAINTPGAEEALEICVDAPTIQNQFCDSATRATGTGEIIDFVQQPANVASFTTKGYDLNLIYRLDPAKLGAQRDLGIFTFRLIGNKLQDLTFINVPNAVPDVDEGEGPREDGGQAPEWQASFDLTWVFSGLTLNYGLSYFDETQRFTSQERRGNPDIAERRYFDYSVKLTQDLLARYDFRQRFAIYAGVNNIEDQEPDFTETAYPVAPVGRFFFGGVQVRFGG